jgi:hypothetical protein
MTATVRLASGVEGERGSNGAGNGVVNEWDGNWRNGVGRLLVEEECRSGRGVVVGEERWWERRLCVVVGVK